MLKSTNNIYLVYEYLNGGKLCDKLENIGNFSEYNSLKILE